MVGTTAFWIGVGDCAVELPVFVGVGTGDFCDYGGVFGRRETE